MSRLFGRLLRSSRPVMLMTVLVAVIGLSGTAYATKFGASIGHGSAHGAKGDRGIPGVPGVLGGRGRTGRSGARGPIGLTGAQGPAGVAGARGPTGETGDGGSPGAAGADAVVYFAAVDGGGALSPTRLRNVTATSRTAIGSYDVLLAGAPDVAGCVAIAQLAGPGSATANPDALGHVSVQTFDPTGAAADGGFVVTVSC